MISVSMQKQQQKDDLTKKNAQHYEYEQKCRQMTDRSSRASTETTNKRELGEGNKETKPKDRKDYT